jgi:hypothetical protein
MSITTMTFAARDFSARRGASAGRQAKAPASRSHSKRCRDCPSRRPGRSGFGLPGRGRFRRIPWHSRALRPGRRRAEAALWRAAKAERPRSGPRPFWAQRVWTCPGAQGFATPVGGATRCGLKGRGPKFAPRLRREQRLQLLEQPFVAYATKGCMGLCGTRGWIFSSLGPLDGGCPAFAADLAVVSLNDRKAQMDFLELRLPFDWDNASSGSLGSASLPTPTIRNVNRAIGPGLGANECVPSGKWCESTAFRQPLQAATSAITSRQAVITPAGPNQQQCLDR